MKKNIKPKNKKFQNISNAVFTIEKIKNHSKYTNLVFDKKFPKYILLINDNPLKTPLGNYFIHENFPLLQQISWELDLKDTLDPSEPSLYSMFCTYKDFVEKNDNDISRNDIYDLLLTTIDLKTQAGPEQVNQRERMNPLREFFDENNLPFLTLPAVSDIEDLKDYINEDKEFSNDFNYIVDFFTAEFNKLDKVQRTVIITSIHAHHSFIFGFLLAIGRCSPNEFSNALLSLEGILHKTFSIVNKEDNRTYLQDYLLSANILIQFLRLASPTKHEILDLISKGESKNLEFKSTLRKNLKTKQIDKKIEYSTLKTIVAFLNTDGGILLVGISDDGEVVGIELDDFPSIDKFLLHFKNLIKDKIGLEFIHLIKYKIVTCKGKNLLRVDCKQSNKPVFLKTSSQKEEFYVRSGPSSDKLEGNQLIRYVEDRFKK